MHRGPAKYDWRSSGAKLKALPQSRTGIVGVDIHFIHVRSRHEGALSLIMTHHWPGSITELLETIAPLTNPTAHGTSAADASTTSARRVFAHGPDRNLRVDEIGTVQLAEDVCATGA
jgi:Epoxide hydrolase N terminus